MLAQRDRFQPLLPSALFVLSLEDVRKRLIVPRVRISSVEIPFRIGFPFPDRSMDGVGVRELEDDDEPDVRLKGRKMERPLDLGHPDV